MEIAFGKYVIEAENSLSKYKQHENLLFTFKSTYERLLSDVEGLC
jgi:hypothetical protein